MHGWLAWMRKFAGDCRHLRLAENWKDSLQNTSWRRHGYLMGLQERNERLFFKVLMTHTRELLPIIDLPVRSLRLPRARCGCTSTVSSHITCTDCVGLTAGSSHACADGILSSHHPVFHVWNRRPVGTFCESHGLMFRSPPRGLYLGLQDRGEMPSSTSSLYIVSCISWRMRGMASVSTYSLSVASQGVSSSSCGRGVVCPSEGYVDNSQQKSTCCRKRVHLDRFLCYPLRRRPRVQHAEELAGAAGEGHLPDGRGACRWAGRPGALYTCYMCVCVYVCFALCNHTQLCLC